MKGSPSAVWIVGLLLHATGCNVSSSGLGNRPDAADGPSNTADTRPATTLDAASLLPETRPDAVPAAALDGALDATLAIALDAASERAAPPDVPTPSPDLLLEDSAPVADAPIAIEAESTPDVRLTDDATDASDAGDAGDGPLAPRPDSPVIVQVDGPALDTLVLDLAPLDLPQPDLASVDRAPDLPPIVDVRPDLSRPDLGPQPTSNWMIDNTTSIGGFTPAILGAPAVTAMDAGMAVCFDGTRDGMVLATNPIQGMRQFTVEALVFPEFTGGADTRLIQIIDNNNLRLVVGMRSVASGNWHALVTFSGGGPGATIEDTNNTHPSNQWYWLTVTYDGQTASVYVDGALDSSRDLTFGPMTAGSVSLASRPNGQFSFPGCVRDVKFFASALSAPQLDKP